MNIYIYFRENEKRNQKKKKAAQGNRSTYTEIHKEISVDKYMQSDADNFLVPFLTNESTTV
jgi:hypothetical protein